MRKPVRNRFLVTQEGEKVFFEWIDFLTDAIFDKLEAYERNRKAAQEMLSDGISEFKICKYMGINKNDLKMLLSNSHRIHENFQRKAKNFIYSTYHIDK